MYIVELKNGEWYCSESRKLIEEITGKITSPLFDSNVKNAWYQPFNYLSGVMSDFFQINENGIKIEGKPMRGWIDDLPLSMCINGNVKFLGKIEPIWYREILSNKIERR